MKTYSFGIVGEASNSNLTSILPGNFVINGKRFINTGSSGTVDHYGNEHDAPEITIKVDFYHDDKYIPQQFPMSTVTGGVMVQVSRLNKGVYNQHLNRIFRGLPGYKEILVYSKAGYVPWAGGTYLFRTPHGARGCGFGIVPEGRTPYWVQHNLSKARKEGSLKIATDVGILIEPDSHLTADKVEQNTLDNSAWNQFVEFIDNVRVEYRLLTDYMGNFSIAVKRKREERSNGMVMAIGSDANPEDIFNLTEDQARARGDEVLAGIIQHLKPIPHMPIHSFDLFITEDGKWGFFEASCEFGESAVPCGWVLNQAKLYMESLSMCLPIQENDHV